MHTEATFQHPDTEYVLTSWVARELGCSPDHVRHLERSGKLPAVRANGTRLFRPADVARVKRERQDRRKTR